MTSLEIALDKARLAQVRGPLDVSRTALEGSEKGVSSGDSLTPEFPIPNISEGLAVIFEDNPLSKPVGCTTVAFARQFCADDPYYTWRKL